MKQTQHGYIALISVIILAGIVSALTAGLGFGVWQAQQGTSLEHAYAQAREYAKSCARIAQVKLLNDIQYRGPETVQLQNGGTCIVVSITPTSGYTIETTSTVRGSVAAFLTELDGTTLAIRAQSQSP